eukprot:c7092_g1_i1.p1 GENE.c7092_g1_i1~~c7092_g1_i1.p1  ORF type:complete len:500 (+),score=104.67 c7092_g1_i1:22-1500(+)
MADEAPIKVVKDVHPMAMKRKDMRDLAVTLTNWMSKHTKASKGFEVRDPCLDFQDGVVIFALLEGLYGSPVARYNEQVASDRAKLENLTIACAALERLGVEAIADGSWTPAELLEGSKIAAWSLSVAIALRFNIDRELNENVILATSIQSFRKGADKPFLEKTARTYLTPSRDELTRIRTDMAAKYGFVLLQLDEVSDEEAASLVEWVQSVVGARGSKISSAASMFQNGINLWLLLEVLTGSSVAVLTGALLNEAISNVEQAKANVAAAFDAIGKLQLETLSCTADDVITANKQSVLRMVRGWSRTDFSDMARDAVENAAAMFEPEDGANSSSSLVTADPTAPTDELAYTGDGWFELSDADDDVEREPDVFDKLFASEPAKVEVVTQSLLRFANTHLEAVGLSVSDPCADFADGVLVVALISLLEKRHISIQAYRSDPLSREHKVTNVRFALARMREAGLEVVGVRARDIAKEDPKAILRLLYLMHRKYRTA